MRYTGFASYHLHETVRLTEISKIERVLTHLYRKDFLIFQSQLDMPESTDDFIAEVLFEKIKLYIYIYFFILLSNNYIDDVYQSRILKINKSSH